MSIITTTLDSTLDHKQVHVCIATIGVNSDTVMVSVYYSILRIQYYNKLIRNVLQPSMDVGLRA